jgi:hypothetical protein
LERKPVPDGLRNDHLSVAAYLRYPGGHKGLDTWFVASKAL